MLVQNEKKWYQQVSGVLRRPITQNGTENLLLVEAETRWLQNSSKIPRVWLITQNNVNFTGAIRSDRAAVCSY